MSLLTSRRKPCVSHLAFGAALILQCAPLATACAVQQQEGQSSQTQQQSSQQQGAQPQQNAQGQPAGLPRLPERKQKKVWTNDEIISLRTPADIYLLERQAQIAAAVKEAAKKLAAAKQIKEAGLTMELPSTAEETRRSITAKQDRVKDLQDGIDRLNKDLPDAPPDKRPETEKQIGLMNGYLRKAQVELKVLQAHLQDFAGTKGGGEPPSAPEAPKNPR